MKKYLTALLMLLVLLSVFPGCQASTTTSGETIDRHEKLLEILNEAKKEFNIPALGAIILNSNSIIDKAIIGVRSIESSQEATFNDHFHLGSNTKAITGFLAAKLVEDGIITWDTRFFDLFPELKDGSREDYYRISLSDLLSHQAQIPPLKSGASALMEKIPELEGDIKERRLKFCQYILGEEPVRPFFHTYTYSNAGYVLAASMLEKASGSSWEALVQEILVDDLKLSANVGWPIDLGEEQPRGHLPGSYVGKESDDLTLYDIEYHYENEDILNPAGDLNMDMLDYASYIQLNLQGLNGIDNYLSSDTYQYIHCGISHYSIGWENSKNNGVTISEHSGSKGNFFCHTYIVKEKDMAIIVFANSGILNALNPIEYVLGGKRLHNYLNQIQNVY
jgi:D-alanyl-D-alanine carboxypeptidase